LEYKGFHTCLNDLEEGEIAISIKKPPLTHWGFLFFSDQVALFLLSEMNEIPDIPVHESTIYVVYLLKSEFK